MACKYFHCVSTITVGAASVNLAFITSPSVVDTEKFCFQLKDSIPSAGAALPVTLSVNGAVVPLLNKYGNPVTGADLLKCRTYKGYYGATEPHVIIHNSPMRCAG